MCGIGLILIMLDSYLIDLEDVPAHGFTDINPKLYFREPWMRVVIGNIFPFITALILSKISKYTVDLR